MQVEATKTDLAEMIRVALTKVNAKAELLASLITNSGDDTYRHFEIHIRQHSQHHEPRVYFSIYDSEAGGPPKEVDDLDNALVSFAMLHFVHAKNPIMSQQALQYFQERALPEPQTESETQDEQGSPDSRKT